MNYQQAEQFLLSLSNLPRQEYMNDPHACGVYLKRMQFLLDLLGNPEKQIPHYIHVTGTSGKGSVSTYLHNILVADGKKVGLTTSPHPTKLTERWRTNDKNMSEREFIQIVETFKPVLDQYVRTSPYDMVSFFEITTAIALYYFAQKKVEWAVVEVGCGGRYDSTNILPWKDVAIITNIGLDHTEILGDTKEKIAYEKAGIIMKDSAVFIGEKNKRLQSIFTKEWRKVSGRSILFTPTTPPTVISRTITGQRFKYNNKTYAIQAPGIHQTTNAALAIDVAEYLGCSTKAIQTGLQRATQPLRMEVVQHSPTIILDGAHNADKIKSSVETILSMKKKNQRIHLVLGFSENKDTTSMIKKLTSLQPVSVACTRNTSNAFRKVMSPIIMERIVKKILPKTTTNVFLEPQEALHWSKSQAKKQDIILVTGSIFLSGELRR